MSPSNRRRPRTPPLGHLVRLIPLQLNELPTHPAITSYLDQKPQRKHSSSSSNSLYSNAPSNPNLDRYSHPKLVPFLTEVLDEAVQFCDGVPKNFTQRGKPTKEHGILNYKRDFCSDEISRIPWKNANIPRKARLDTNRKRQQRYGESWFARASVHENSDKNGRQSASWKEFDQGLRENHSLNEMAYTPDVFDARLAIDWEAETHNLELEKYADPTMEIREMCHKLPWPLRPRVFQVLVITAKIKIPEKESSTLYNGDAALSRPKWGGVVVQIPVELKTLPEAFYGSGRHLIEGEEAIMRQKVVFA